MTLRLVDCPQCRPELHDLCGDHSDLRCLRHRGVARCIAAGGHRENAEHQPEDCPESVMYRKEK